MIGERMKKLLGKAAGALNKGMSPFEHWFLSENGVTLDECMTMSEHIAVLIKWFVGQSEKAQIEILLHELGSLAKETAAHVGYEDALQAADTAIADALQAIDESLEEQE